MYVVYKCNGSAFFSGSQKFWWKPIENEIQRNINRQLCICLNGVDDQSIIPNALIPSQGS